MIYESLKSTSVFVREMLLKVEKIKTTLTISIPKEDQSTEKRIALTPETIALLVEAGYKVVIEKGAGKTINYSDTYYADSGAIIVDSHKEALEGDIIIKIAPPTLEEVEMMKPRANVYSFLQLFQLKQQTLELLCAKRINAAAYDLIHDNNGVSPFVTAISEIEGATSVIVAAEMMSNAHGGKGILMGGVPGVSPTEVVIIGAGVAGTIAARASLALGAYVKVFDDDINKLRTIQHMLGRTLFTSTLQPNVLRNTFRSADVVIGSMQYVNKTHFFRISSDLIKEMKKGSLIIDLRMPQGGCFETTMEACVSGHPAIFDKYGIHHVCETSLSSRVARTATISLSNIFGSMFLKLSDSGGVDQFAKYDRGFASGFYVYSGKMVNAYVANHFNLPTNDIGLFLPGY